MLISEGIAVKQTAASKNTSFYIAANFYHVEVVRTLLAHEGIAVDRAREGDGCTPLGYTPLSDKGGSY